VQMRTLPVEPLLNKTEKTDAAAKPAALLYRHGVEVVVRGNYLDMITTMAALEAMPTQLFWSGAQLEAETWPSSRLTLTLHTLSLDEKWMKL
jgi:MSHA biogenesis protein MshJ